MMKSKIKIIGILLKNACKELIRDAHEIKKEKKINVMGCPINIYFSDLTLRLNFGNLSFPFESKKITRWAFENAPTIELDKEQITM